MCMYIPYITWHLIMVIVIEYLNYNIDNCIEWYKWYNKAKTFYSFRSVYAYSRFAKCLIFITSPKLLISLTCRLFQKKYLQTINDFRSCLNFRSRYNQLTFLNCYFFCFSNRIVRNILNRIKTFLLFQTSPRIRKKPFSMLAVYNYTANHYRLSVNWILKEACNTFHSKKFQMYISCSCGKCIFKSLRTCSEVIFDKPLFLFWYFFQASHIRRGI